MVRRSFARSKAPSLPHLKRIKEEEKERLKQVREERKRARANLKKINDRITKLQNKR
jgi:hypothetical protein